MSFFSLVNAHQSDRLYETHVVVVFMMEISPMMLDECARTSPQLIRTLRWSREYLSSERVKRLLMDEYFMSRTKSTWGWSSICIHNYESRHIGFEIMWLKWLPTTTSDWVAVPATVVIVFQLHFPPSVTGFDVGFWLHTSLRCWRASRICRWGGGVFLWPLWSTLPRVL